MQISQPLIYHHTYTNVSSNAQNALTQALSPSVRQNMPQNATNSHSDDNPNGTRNDITDIIKEHLDNPTKLQNKPTMAETAAKEARETKESKEAQKTDAKDTQNSANGTDFTIRKNRITYGLKVIELMSDDEYRAFLLACEGLSDAEKIHLAQSLYRFTSFYRGKKEAIPNNDIKAKEAHKAFGVYEEQTQGFINRYKNAYAKVLETSVRA